MSELAELIEALRATAKIDTWDTSPNPMLDRAATAIEQLMVERDEGRSIVRDIYWMAHRYVDGRATYAVGMFNDAIKKAYDAGWLTHHKDGPERQYALDGMSPEWHSIVARAEAAEARVTEQTIEIEAAKLFGVGFFAPIVSDATREWHRNEARRALAHREPTNGR